MSMSSRTKRSVVWRSPKSHLISGGLSRRLLHKAGIPKSKIFGTTSLILLAMTIIFFLTPSSSFAKITDLRPSGPLKVRSQNPLYLQLLALPMESPQTLNRDQFELQIETTFSNVFEFDRTGRTRLNIDMELWRTALTFGYGLTDKLDVKIEIPFISNYGGFLDGFIQGYHDAFNLPTGGRQLVSNNQFSFNLSQDGKTLFNHSSTTINFSDIVARFKYLISDHWQWPFKFAFVPYIKFPTGKISDGFSSGHFDLGFSLLAEKSLKRFHFVSHIGYVFITGHANLAPILKHGFLSFGQSFEFQILDGLSIIAQLTGNTSAFKNVDSDELTKIILDLNIGFAGSFPIKHSLFDEFFYQWSFSEDVTSVGPSVDFSIMFLAGVRY